MTLESLRGSVEPATVLAGGERGDAVEQHRREGLELTTLAGVLASKLGNLPFERIDEAIVETFAEVAELVGIDRASVLRFTEDSDALVLEHEWARKGLEPNWSSLGTTRLPNFPWFARDLMHGRAAKVDDVASLGDDDAEAAAWLLDAGVRALICVPMLRSEKLAGVITFSCVDPRDWSPHAVVLLRLAAQMILNVLERKAADDALRETQTRFAQISDNVDRAFWLIGLAPLRVLYVSPIIEKIAGIAPGVYFNAPERFADSILPEDLGRFADLFAKVLDEPGELEYRVRRSDGEVRWLHTRAFPVRDDHGSVYRVGGVTTDVTQRKTADEALGRHRAFERLITHLATDFINLPAAGLDIGVRTALRQLARSIAADWGAVYLTDNESRLAEPIYEWRDGEVDPPDEPLRAFDLDQSDPFGRALRRARVLRIHDLRELREGTLQHQAYLTRLGVRALVNLPLVSEGELVGFLGFATVRSRHAWPRETIVLLKVAAEMLANAVQRIRTEKKMRRREAELAHALRLGTMGELAAGLAHELNQPLAAILGFARGCEHRIENGDIGSKELVTTIRKISEQALRAGEVIRTMRAHVRKGEPRREWHDVNAMVREATRLLEDELERQCIRLTLDLEGGLPPVQVDATQVEQVLLNLVCNATEAVQSVQTGTRNIRISTRRDADDAIEIVVADSGIGSEMDAIERLFEPFYTTKEQGLGLGLSISKSIVEAHGGRMWAVRASGRGLAFHVQLQPRHHREVAS